MDGNKDYIGCTQFAAELVYTPCTFCERDIYRFMHDTFSIVASHFQFTLYRLRYFTGIEVFTKFTIGASFPRCILSVSVVN